MSQLRSSNSISSSITATTDPFFRLISYRARILSLRQSILLLCKIATVLHCRPRMYTMRVNRGSAKTRRESCASHSHRGPIEQRSSSTLKFTIHRAANHGWCSSSFACSPRGSSVPSPLFKPYASNFPSFFPLRLDPFSPWVFCATSRGSPTLDAKLLPLTLDVQVAEL
jgi:hypothetical protein